MLFFSLYSGMHGYALWRAKSALNLDTLKMVTTKNAEELTNCLYFH